MVNTDGRPTIACCGPIPELHDMRPTEPEPAFVERGFIQEAANEFVAALGTVNRTLLAQNLYATAPMSDALFALNKALREAGA